MKCTKPSDQGPCTSRSRSNVGTEGQKQEEVHVQQFEGVEKRADEHGERATMIQPGLSGSVQTEEVDEGRYIVGSRADSSSNERLTKGFLKGMLIGLMEAGIVCLEAQFWHWKILICRSSVAQLDLTSCTTPSVLFA